MHWPALVFRHFWQRYNCKNVGNIHSQTGVETLLPLVGGLHNFKVKETGCVVLNLQVLLPELYIYFFLLHQFLGKCVGASCWSYSFNPLNAELNPICHLLALLGVHFLHVSRRSVKSLTLRLLMSYIYIYIYGAPILDVSRSHTKTQHSR